MLKIILLWFGLPACSLSRARKIHVAAASNSSSPMKALAALFEHDSGYKEKVLTGSGAAGKFHMQIRNGSPFELLLAADDETPARLEAEGLGSRP